MESDIEKSFQMLVYKHPVNLSPEQVIFCQEFIKAAYKIAPAIKATFGTQAEGWTDQDITKVGQRLLQLPKIRKYLQEEIENRVTKLKTTSDWVAQKYRDWSEIDVTDYIRVEYNKRGRPQIKLLYELDELPKQVRSAIKSVSVNSYGDLKIEFVDQKGALDQLAKLQGLIDTKMKVEVEQPILLSFDKEDEDA